MDTVWKKKTGLSQASRTPERMYRNWFWNPLSNLAINIKLFLKFLITQRNKFFMKTWTVLQTNCHWINKHIRYLGTSWAAPAWQVTVRCELYKIGIIFFPNLEKCIWDMTGSNKTTTRLTRHECQWLSFANYSLNTSSL